MKKKEIYKSCIKFFYFYRFQRKSHYQILSEKKQNKK